MAYLSISTISNKFVENFNILYIIIHFFIVCYNNLAAYFMVVDCVHYYSNVKSRILYDDACNFMACSQHKCCTSFFFIPHIISFYIL